MPNSEVEFSSATYDIQENGGQAVLTLNRTGDITGEAQVNYATSDVTAQAGSDYQAKSGEVLFPAFSSSATITIPIINDSAVESTEQFTVTLTPTGSARIGGRGTATVNIIDEDGPTPSPTPAAQPQNLSTRMRTDVGDNVGIGGFIITGSVSKHVVIRAIGPSLTKFGFTAAEVLDDPTLEVHGPGGFVVRNNNWKDTQEDQIRNTGLPPENDRESAIDATLPAGNYTAIVRGREGTPQAGIALVEVFDIDTAANSKLSNLGTRAFVGIGNDVVIAGFILGNNQGNDRIIVRGRGPSLSAFNVPTPLQDPLLELRTQNGTLIRANNDWQDDTAQADEISGAGFAPPHPKESAIAATLAPGQYTATLSGVNSGTGNGLVEVFDRGGP